MSDRDDEVLRAAQAHAQRAALAQIENDARWAANEYAKKIRENDAEAAAYAMRQYSDAVVQYQMIAGTPAQQQTQPPQPQGQQQPQLTPVQQQILERYPGIRNKWQEAQYWDRCLQAQGYDPNSDAYAHAMLIGLGVFDPSGQRESNEIASADTMVEAVRNSKYAKDFTREQYDHLANYRDELKKAGFLRMDDSQ